MWFLYLLLTYLFFISFMFYNAKTKWMYLKCPTNYLISKNYIYSFFILLFLLFFSTLRFPKYDTDTYNYFRLFDEINSSFYQVKFTLKPECGYIAFNKIIGYFTTNHQIFLLLINIFVLCTIFKFLNKYSKNVWFSVLLFVFLGYFDSTMTLIRFNIALAITLFSYQYLLEKKFFNFLFCVFIASLFHLSAWIFTISYIFILCKNKLLSNQKYFLFLLSLFILFFFIDYLIHAFLGFFQFYSSYENNKTFGVQSSMKLAPILEFLTILSITIFAHILLKKRQQQSNIDILFFYLALIACYFTMLSFIFTPIGRIGKYFSIGTIVLIPNLISTIPNIRNNVILKISVIMICVLRYFIIAYFRPEWYQIYPYKFFFE